MSRLVVAATGKAANELWWVWALQAALALFFGITAIFWPALTLLTLVYLFSAFILGLGIIELMNGLFSIGRRESWWLTLLVGIAGIIAGVYLIRHTGISLQAFILLISLLFIARGIIELIRAFTDRLSTSLKIFLIIIGVAAIVSGVLIMAQPVAGGVAFVWVLGLYGLVLGCIGLATAFELRNELLEAIGPEPEIEKPRPGRKKSEAPAP